MPGTTRVAIKKDILNIESNNLLKRAKDGKAEKLIKIMPYMVHTDMHIDKLNLSMDQKIEMQKIAQREADRIEEEMLKEVKKLVQLLEKYEREDKAGSTTAGDDAQKAVKKTTDELDDILPEFGKHVRKAIEKGMRMKFPSSVKSTSSGMFKGLHLIAKFEHGGANAELTKDYQDAAKTFDKAGDTAGEIGRADKQDLDALKLSVKNEISALSKPGNSPTLDAVKLKIRAFQKDFEANFKGVDQFKKFLDTTAKSLDAEKKEMAKALAGSDNRSKKDKLDLMARELATLRKSVDERIRTDTQITQALKECDKVANARAWQVKLTDINWQLVRIEPINTEKFDKAIDAMVRESKKT